jgi:hypothetical protein
VLGGEVMITEQFSFYKLEEVESIVELGKLVNANLILMFGSKEFICNKKVFDTIRNKYSESYIIGCTTAGEIYRNQVNDGTLTVTAIYFEKSEIKIFSSEIEDVGKDYEKGLEIAKSIPTEKLAHVFLLAEGENINGSKIVEGLVDGLPEHAKITGGLAGNGNTFKDTFVIANDYAKVNQIAAVAFYGDKIRIGYGSVGGWDTFGIERFVTKSKENIVYELDGRPILDLYNDYLGEYAKDLPASGLLFPLSVRSADNVYNYVRAVASVDEKSKSLRFFGEVPQGYYARLMHANSNNLINGAMKAAENSIKSINSKNGGIAILISCVARKVVLNQMIDEEIEAVRNIFGNDMTLTGFYSYGEIAPSNKDRITEFHNQTMTITLIGED